MGAEVSEEAVALSPISYYGGAKLGSEGIISSFAYVKAQGNKIIGLIGYSGGKLKELSDITLHVPVQSMQITEDIHMVFDHLMMSVFYKYLCGKEHFKE